MLQLAPNLALLVTPFGSDGQVDLQSLVKLIEFVRSNGADGAVVLGTTGEFFTLSIEERKGVIRAATRARDKSFQIGVGCGDTSTLVAQELAVFAQQQGASFVLALPPYYLATERQNVTSHLLSIAGSVELPVMVYDGGGGIPVPSIDLAELAATRSNIAAVKVAGSRPFKVAEIRRLSTGLQIYCGEDHLLATELIMGATGACIAGSSLQPQVVSQIIDLIARGQVDEALSIHATRIMPQWAATGMVKSEFVPAFKLVLYWMGVIQSAQVRPPLLPLDEAKQRELRAALRSLELM